MTIDHGLARTWAAMALALAALGAQAVQVSGPGGTAEQGRRLVPTPVAPDPAAQALELVPARLDAVNLAAGQVTVNGRVARLHPKALRVIGPAGLALAGAGALVAGQQLRFALEPGSAPDRRIVLIYIDR